MRNQPPVFLPEIRSLVAGLLLGTVWGEVEAAVLVASGTNVSLFAVGSTILFETVLGVSVGIAAAAIFALWVRRPAVHSLSPLTLVASGLLLAHIWLTELVQVRLVGPVAQGGAGFAGLAAAAGMGWLWARRERSGRLGSWYWVVLHAGVMIGAFTALRAFHSVSHRGGEPPAGWWWLTGLAAAGLWWGAGRWPARREAPGGLSVRSWAGATLSALTAAVVIVLGLRVAFGTERPLTSSHQSSPAPAKGRNVILIVLDALRRDRLSCYGYHRTTTPRIDAFAEDAVRYERAVAPSSWTLPTHASIFTGLYPCAHRAHRGGLTFDTDWISELLPEPVLSDEAVTLAELLLEAGYDTAAITANAAYMHRSFGLDQGFLYFDDRRPMTLRYRTLGYQLWRLAFPDHYRQRNHPSRRAGTITDEAIAWLRRHQSRRFFLFLNYMDPHEPYNPLPPFDRMFPGRRPGVREPREAVMSGSRPITPEEYGDLVARYDGSVASMDRHIGRLLDYCRDAGLSRNTAVIITSDHGQSLGEHRHLYHGSTLYESELAVPLIMRIPGGSPRIEPDLFSLVDLFPVLLELVGVPAPPDTRPGTMEAAVHAPMAELHPNPRRIKDYGDRFDRTLRAVYLENYKCILSDAGPAEVYDLVADPDETDNIASRRADIVAEAGAMVARVLEALAAEGTEGPALSGSEDMIERLKAVGYIGK